MRNKILDQAKTRQCVVSRWALVPSKRIEGVGMGSPKSMTLRCNSLSFDRRRPAPHRSPARGPKPRRALSKSSSLKSFAARRCGACKVGTRPLAGGHGTLSEKIGTWATKRLGTLRSCTLVAFSIKVL